MAQQDSLVGRTLGQYQILDEIGRGGMATVYRAWQPTLRRHVALKVLASHLVDDREFTQRFQQEAVSAANLSHFNIVTIYDVAQESGYYYIAMEYIEGRPLDRVIMQDGALPLARVIRILRQVADALDYAHQRNFIHRDIKPANILVTAEDHAVLTDFGIVKALEGSGVTASFTTAGTILGTPAYMSPEHIQGEAVDYRTDLYSLGIVCYEMLSGRPPFGGTTATVLYAQVNTSPPNIRQLNPAVPEHVERALMRMLAKRPEDRFQSAGAFVDALASEEIVVKIPPEKTALMPPDKQPTPYSQPAQSGWPQKTPPPPKGKGHGCLIGGLIGGAVLAVLAAVVAVVILLPVVFPKKGTEVPTTTEVLVAKEQIAFTSKRDGNAEIYVMNSDGSGQTNVTNSLSEDYYPRWSPDGARISFHSYPPGEEAAQIYVVDLDTGQRRLVNTGVDNAKFADWSPDGQDLVFAGERDGDWDLYIVDLATGTMRRLTQGPANDFFPAWSPSGKEIAFTRDDGDDREIYVVRADGSNLRNLSNSPGWDWHPSWSPDGQKIGFTGERTGTRQIYVMNADGSGQRQLTDTPDVHNMEPRWNPDGTTIVFSSNRDGNWEIYVMNVDGTNVMRLTSNVEHDYNPHWR